MLAFHPLLMRLTWHELLQVLVLRPEPLHAQALQDDAAARDGTLSAHLIASSTNSHYDLICRAREDPSAMPCRCSARQAGGAQHTLAKSRLHVAQHLCSGPHILGPARCCTRKQCSASSARVLHGRYGAWSSFARHPCMQQLLLHALRAGQLSSLCISGRALVCDCSVFTELSRPSALQVLHLSSLQLARDECADLAWQLQTFSALQRTSSHQRAIGCCSSWLSWLHTKPPLRRFTIDDCVVDENA